MSIRSASPSTLTIKPNDTFRVVQLTPAGSSCSIQIGKGLTDAPVGSLRNVYLVVTDPEACSNVGSRSVRSGTRRRLEPGMEVSHRGPTPLAETMQASPTSPTPDGNSWVLQERGYRNP